MKRFNVLDKNLDIHRHTLLEASAGTGKTFSIENLVVRLLAEEPPCLIEEILIVTFTRAATGELKERVHQNIERALLYIKNENSDQCPDYLRTIIEDENKKKIVKRRLEHALADFDQARITTIHAFCERTLKEFSFVFDKETESMNELVEIHEIRKIIHDFFLTGMKPQSYSPVQIQYVLKHCRQDIRKLENDIIKHLTAGCKIASTDSFETLFLKFKEKFNTPFEKEKIIEDFYQYAPCFKKIYKQKSKEVKPEILESVEKFAQFCSSEISYKAFEDIVSDGLLFADHLKIENMKSKAALPEAVNYPHLLSWLQTELVPIVEEAKNPEIIIAKMAGDCQKSLEKYLHEEEKFQYDDLLKKMLKRASGAHFAENLRQIYKAVIIDEFQDTDPIQWGIFKTLFFDDPKKRSYLYLVGDPKQSIYAFRQADIYTYMSAVQTLGKDHVASLDVNYRSDPSLVKALNALFSKENISEFFHLPKLKQSLSYHSVLSGKESNPLNFLDQKGAVHFLIGEEKKSGKKWPPQAFLDGVYAAIIDEMVRLKNDCGIGFSSWAILVKDRYQADEFARYSARCGIPTHTQKQKNLIRSTAFQVIKDILNALIHPKELNALKIVLGGCLFRWSPKQLKELQNESRLIETYQMWSNLCEKAFSEGFSEFISHLMQTKDNQSEILYSRSVKESEEFLHEFFQICDLISDYQNRHNHSITRCQQYLLDLEAQGEEILAYQNCDDDAVQILTIHMSKGLEFDLVVPLGLISRTNQNNRLIPIQTGSEYILKPVLDTDSDIYQNYMDELDAEKMRQLYVAMTRAKYRLYIPLYIEKDPSSDSLKGKWSPLELFLSSFKGDLLEWIKTDGCQNNITSSSILSSEPCFYEDHSSHHDLIAPQDVKILAPQVFIQSFSSLTQHKASSPIVGVPHDFSSEIKNPFTLPSGREIGLILHEILETISYESVKEAANPQHIHPIIESYLLSTPFSKWLQVIADVIFTTLKKPFLEGQCISDIPSEKQFHEIEFLYPKTGSDDFLKGVIDFVCECRGRYYIIDWKSNWLGPDQKDYDPNNMKRSMEEHDYFFQAEIYEQALKRYLKSFETRPFEECYGGTYYLFLRGINLESDCGIYFVDREKSKCMG